MPIEFDYTIKRNEGSGIRVFKPAAIKGPISNISVISAPNSAGKSTLMNLIALSLYGGDQNAKSVNSSLKAQIHALSDFEIQKLTFWIRITDKSGKSGLMVRKDSFDTNDIIRKEILEGTERLIDSVRFHEKYDLIYDIPDNPLERLKELTNSVKLQQTNWRTKLSRLRIYIDSNIKDLLRMKEDYDVEAIKQEIAKVDEELVFINKSRTNLEQQLSRLEKYYYLRRFKETKSDYESVRDASRDVNNEKRKSNNEKGAQIKEFRVKAAEHGRIMETIKDLKGTIIQFTQNSGISSVDGFTKWIRNAKQAPTSRSLKDDLTMIGLIDEKCNQSLSGYKDDSTLGEVEFYDKLLSWIRENMGSNYQVPGTEITFSALVERLDSIVESNRESFRRKKQLESLSALIKDLKNEVEKFNEISKEISLKYEDVSSAQRDTRYEEINKNSKKLNTQKKDLSDKLQALKSQLLKFEIHDEDEVQQAFNVHLMRFPELNKYGTTPLQTVNDEVSTLKSNINGYSQKEQKEKLRKESFEKQLEKAEKLKPHKYQDYSEGLSTLLNSIDDLIHMISNWETLIDRYKRKESGRRESFQNSSEEDEYFKKISEYLAHRMKFITHIDKRYELREVDLINSRFVAIDGTLIYFPTMGTGQRQQAYLLNRLRYNDKIILAMFDEVAMMSQSTMQPIVDLMKELRDEGKLMVGLLVSPNEEVKITEW